MRSHKQFAGLPFRIRGSELDVLLITTRRKRRWSVPKGWPIEAGKPQRTAEIEAFEEAGLIGKAKAKPVGRYKHRKDKGKRKIECDICVFPLKVRKQKKSWPEREQRDAMWLPARKAAARVHKAELRRLIERFARQKSVKLKHAKKSELPISTAEGGHLSTLRGQRRHMAELARSPRRRGTRS
jgi:8-oxo-dGTP pyrophosphatase MutT (NUDIX family)